MRTDGIRFRSEDLSCAGTIYRPEGDGPLPAVSLLHGFGAVRRMRNIPEVVTLLAEAGILALAIDLRFLGESEGAPRQQVLPHAQPQDLRNAPTYRKSLPGVDNERIGF
jgi:dienelactone hydrolase